MALNNVIRRSASRIAPSIFRVCAGSQRCMHHHPTSAVSAAVSCSRRNILWKPFPSIIPQYSTKTSTDDGLLRVIESEIKYAEESQEGDEGEEVPKDFPFKIVDHPGQQTITLTADHHGETITAEVYMPLITGEENDDDDGDDEGGARGNQSSMTLVIKVSKNGGPFLEFGCSAYPDEITIDSLTVRNPTESEDQIAYEGPDFADLDENLQKGFHRFLEIRGIKPSVTNFLHGYMVEKDSREYITWLKKIKEFVQE